MARLNILIGELLLDRGLISKKDLESILKEQKQTGDAVGQIVVRRGLVSEADLRQALSEQLGISFLSFEDLRTRIDFQLKQLIPRDVAMREMILPLEVKSEQLKIVTARVPSAELLERLKKLTGFSVKFVLGSEEDIRSLMDDFYLEKPESKIPLPDVSALPQPRADESNKDHRQAEPHFFKASVEEYFQSILKRALSDNASDIHFERTDSSVSVRYRLDGILYELPVPPPVSVPLFFMNLKNFSNLEVAGKNQLSSGVFAFEHQGQKVDIHISSIPLISGEKVVMKISPSATQRRGIKGLGLDDQQAALFEEKIQKSYGLMIVAGPKGSGKSTTLYAGLMRRISQKTNILTVEDPVKFRVAGINQVAVQADIGLTFAAVLRAFLRQDPDVILVGEVSDPETAEICVRASLTGHLVMTAIHADDAESVISQLMDMGIKSYLLAGSLFFIVIQRLIRCLCQKCKQVDNVDELTRLRLGLGTPMVYRASEIGCESCRNTGYWGRTLICELLEVDDGLRAAIQSGAKAKISEAVKNNKNQKTLLQSGLSKVEQGLTSLDELKRLNCLKSV